MESVLGTIIDPMADKALMTVVTVGLAWEGSLPRE
jgi:phosphatidylglycerophosphate synthase